MTGTAVFVAFAVFLGWLGTTVDDPTLAGLFVAGSIIAVMGAVLWFVDARRLRRRSRR